MRIQIRNGALVGTSGIQHEDILIENGVIASIRPNLNVDGARVIDASGCFVFPGLIDTHTHFDLDLGVTKTADDFITGTRAAVLGGTTTVLDFATQDRGMTMQDALSLWHRKAEGASCNYGFHMAISEWNDARRREIPEMVRQGVTSFKMYMVYDNMRLSDGAMYEALKAMAACGCIAGVHCENYDLLQARIRELHAAGDHSPAAHVLSRPNTVEAEGVARLMRIAELAGTPVWVVHLSTKEGLEEARRARARGQRILLETCPQYLVLTDDCYLAPDADKFICSPPIRKRPDCDALWNALAKNEIDVIGTDHCSFTMAQKALGGGDFAKTPNGGVGVQNRMQLLYTYGVEAGRITATQLAAEASENAAKLFGMYPRKGILAEGSDADIVIYDPRGDGVISYKTNAHNCDNSPYEGMHVRGRVRDVFVGGVQAVSDGKLIESGLGSFVARGQGSLLS